MSVVTVPRISATEAHMGVSSLDLADRDDALDLIGHLEGTFFLLGCGVLCSIPYVFVGAAAAWLLGV